jgi:mono/diheme cytochrome c family protein
MGPVARWLATTMAVLAAALPEAAGASPAQDYVLHCMGCHGGQAEGVPGRVPPLAHSLARFMRTPAGRSYILRVPGAASSALSDAALAGVLNWLAQTFDAEDLGPGVPLFTVEEVAGQRHTPLLSVLATRQTTVAGLEGSGPAPSQGY